MHLETGGSSPLFYFYIRMLEKAIRDLLQEWIKGKDFFLVDLKVSKDFRIAVFMDKPEGIGVDDCKVISRFLEEKLEAEQLVPENYLLEVSSPGALEPFKVKEQYHKNIGQELEYELADGRKSVGILRKVTEDHILVDERQLNQMKKWIYSAVSLPLVKIKSIRRKLKLK